MLQEERMGRTRLNNIKNNTKKCKYLYIQRIDEYQYRCGISKIKDESFIYISEVISVFMEKLMLYLLNQRFTKTGCNTFAGSLDDIKSTLDITSELEKILNENLDIEHLQNININSKELESNNPEVPSVHKSKRPVDQIDVKTGEIINTFNSIEEAGRDLGVTGSAVGIALRNKKLCRGFIFRYAGISNEDQYKDQPVIKICCSDGKRIEFTCIADAAKDARISAPGLRNRILTRVHRDNHHWIFNKNSSHYN